ASLALGCPRSQAPSASRWRTRRYESITCSTRGRHSRTARGRSAWPPSITRRRCRSGGAALRSYRMPGRHSVLAATALFGFGCTNEGATLPPLGEVLIVVDTNVPVPKLVGALRVDVYDDAGSWLDSRDFAMRRPEDWPGSFSVYTDETTGERDVLVR